MKRLLIAVIFLMITFGCSSESSPPDELIDEQTYEQMFMEFAIINQLDQRLLQKTSQEQIRQLVYEHYNVTEEEFRISHEYYERQIDDQLERVKEMSRTLRTERDSLLSIEREYKKLTTPEQVDSLRQALLNKE